MKIQLFEAFCKEERVTPELVFLGFGKTTNSNNTTIMFWNIRMWMEGQLLTEIKNTDLELGLLAAMIECLEMKFEGLGYSPNRVAIETEKFVMKMAA